METAAEDPNNRMSIETAIELYRQVKGASESLEDFSKRAKKKRELLAKIVLPELFEQKGVSSITQNGYRFTCSYQVRASIHSGQKEGAFSWLRSNDYEDLITETVNASTLSATAKAMAEEGEELDDEFFNTYIAPNTSMTKVK